MTFDRLVFATGDRLQARELAAVEAREAALHAIHVRAVHRTWGVALGFSVAASADHRAVLVGPGLAYDPCGRALVLARPARVPLPPGAQDGSHRLAAAASPAGGGPRWCWLDGGRATAAVTVARVAVVAGLVSGAPDPSGRRVAVAPAYIAGGQLTVVQTGSYLTSVEVNTGHAGFADTPCYFAQAAGPRVGLGNRPRARDPELALRDERADGFTLDVRCLGGRATPGRQIPVTWIGVEAHLAPAVAIPTEEPTAPWCA